MDLAALDIEEPSDPEQVAGGGQPLKGDQRAIADATQASPAVNRGEQPNAQAPLLQPDPPEAIQAALRELVRGYELESDAVRRHKVRVWREGEEFWRGNQNIWFSTKDNNWHTPFEREDIDRAELPRFDYALNLYRSWGLSIIAALVQSPPKIQYLPVSAESQDDIATARAATRVAQLVARNNNLSTLRVKKAYCLWTQGIFATYVRYLVDGGQFGYHDEPTLEERRFQVLPDRFECPACGGYQAGGPSGPPAVASGQLSVSSEQPAAAEWTAQAPGAADEDGVMDPASSQAAGDTAAGAGSTAHWQLGTGNSICRNCGAALGPEDFSPAEYVTATAPTGTRRVPNGAEKLTAFGPLYFKVPPQAQSQRDCYYLIQVEEQHKAVLRAAYPQKADKINDVGSGGEDTYERIVRLSLADAQGSWNSLPMSNLVTYKRAWLRPEAFWAHADQDTRAKLLQLYPDGCRVEFAGDTFLQAIPEKLDDCWVICAGLPGQGIYRDPMGQDAISIQRQINDSANILAEHREMSSAPPILYDARFINGEALAKKRMQPASYVPVVIESVGPQKPMAEMIFQPRLGVDPALWNDGERLAEVGQFITGALPSIFGGGAPNLKTAAAYAQSRDQAMGRMALVWKQMREAEAREMTLAVECFRRNRTDDVEMVIEGKGGGYRSEYIRLSEIRGNVVATPTADEDFPQSFTEIREALSQIMATKDPELLGVIGAPVNRPVVTHYLGLPDLVDPGDDNRAKQFIEIEALMGSAPLVGPNGKTVPSVLPDLYVDDHGVHIAVIKEWAVSEPGLQAKAAQPQGYANVLAHLLAHMDAEQAMAADMAERQAQVQQAGAPPVAPPGVGAPPPHAPGPHPPPPPHGAPHLPPHPPAPGGGKP